MRALESLMGRASAPESVARIREAEVSVHLQYMHHCLLDKAVEQRWHAEWANAARCLRYLLPPHGLRLVAAVVKPGPDLVLVVLQVFD